ncbi:MAG: thioredoxin domain-containing protein [Candidatus Krumholzibacteriia bacterium]
MRQPLPDAAAIAALPPDGGPEFNRLIFASSPYLRQHARNPVDWRPWGEEALAAARAADRPLFLSVGYSTCHWCHVMEHESFEDAEVAALLNAGFVCVKVDREERPDLDAVYMTATQLFTGRGGWPNSLWLTPDGRPWFAGTYFPREDRGPRQPGFLTLLAWLRQLWDERRDEVEKQADAIAAAVAQATALPAGAEAPPALSRALVDDALVALARDVDHAHGGFSGAPKFPPHQALALLLDEHARSGRADLLALVVDTLDGMARGGIHDHVGGGFHRYSTDARWFLPHFEKMLYDNAQLLPVYARASRAAGREDLADVARGIARWLLEDMRDETGGFHAALDADSEGEEGRFYLWTEAELAEQLGADEGALVARVHGCVPGGNYAEEATGRRSGGNILYLPRTIDDAAAAEGLAPAALRQRLADAHARLRAARARRVWPERDDKVLAAWNGLAIAGLARAGALLGEAEWVFAAAEAAGFVLGAMRADGRLLRSWRDGAAQLPAYLDDHAALGLGLLELHAATGDSRWLAEARALADALLADFAAPDGGFYFTGDIHESLLARGRDPFDAALPSGNGLAAQLLLRLAQTAGESRYQDAARRTLEAFAAPMDRAPRGTCTLIAALAEHLAGEGQGPGLPPLAGADGPPADSLHRPPLWVELYTDRTTVRAGASVAVTVRVAIDNGWQLGGDELAGLALRLEGEAEGLALDLPAPGGGSSAPLTGEQLLRGALQVAPDAPPGPRLLRLRLDYQACDDSRCLAPAALGLRAEITVEPQGGSGAPSP